MPRTESRERQRREKFRVLVTDMLTKDEIGKKDYERRCEELPRLLNWYANSEHRLWGIIEEFVRSVPEGAIDADRLGILYSMVAQVVAPHLMESKPRSAIKAGEIAGR